MAMPFEVSLATNTVPGAGASTASTPNPANVGARCCQVFPESSETNTSLVGAEGGEDEHTSQISWPSGVPASFVPVPAGHGPAISVHVAPSSVVIARSLEPLAITSKPAIPNDLASRGTTGTGAARDHDLPPSGLT